MNRKRFDTLLALILTAGLAIAAVAVAVVMFTPSDRDAVIEQLTITGEEILEAAKQYPNQVHLFQPVSDSSAEGESGAFTGLRFDRIGYFGNLSADARTLYTDVGRFTLHVSPNGNSFTLTAHGPEDVSIQWEGHVEESPTPAE